MTNRPSWARWELTHAAQHITHIKGPLSRETIFPGLPLEASSAKVIQSTPLIPRVLCLACLSSILLRARPIQPAPNTYPVSNSAGNEFSTGSLRMLSILTRNRFVPCEPHSNTHAAIPRLERQLCSRYSRGRQIQHKTPFLRKRVRPVPNQAPAALACASGHCPASCVLGF
jgi:hypothetical protein